MGKIDKSQRPPLALNIANRRKALKMSQMDLAEAIGAHRNTVADIERGVSEGWPDTREAIARALNCTVAELYGTHLDTAAKPTQSAMAKTIAVMQEEIDQLRAEIDKFKRTISEQNRVLAQSEHEASIYRRLAALYSERGIELLASVDNATKRSWLLAAIDPAIQPQSHSQAARTQSAKLPSRRKAK